MMTMSRRRPSVGRVLWSLLLGASVLSCRPKDDGDAPALPPADTMTFFELREGARSEEVGMQALTAAEPAAPVAGDHSNVKVAVAAVGLVTLGVHAVLFWPRQFILGVVSTKPTHDGDAWIWRRQFPVLGWDATLRATLPGRLLTEMRVTGLKPENVAYQNFLWYTGDHGAKDGKWTVYAVDQSGPVLTIDWKREAANDKQLTFTNVTAATPAAGDRLSYAIKGKVASMNIHDAKDANGLAADASVVWNVESGAGKLTANGMGYCWETLANGQGNLPCPAGDWPAP